MNDKFYSGFVSLIGRPNVGKSTLMNSLVGEKIAIMSSKPQTTRNRIQAILTEKDYQVVFVDTPGMHKSKNKLGKYMNKSAESTFSDVDIILYLVEPFEKIKESDAAIIEKLKKTDTPVFLVINKTDTVKNEDLLAVIAAYKEVYDFKEIIPVSALKKKNFEELTASIKKYLPEGPKFFPEDMITDQPERQIAAEMIREKALFLLRDEIPHGLAVEITKMSQRKDKPIVDIDATVYCEKDSHKGMIIGKRGAMLKRIGTSARVDIERMTGTSVNLQMWVKVKKEWRDSDFLLKNFGYDSKEL